MKSISTLLFFLLIFPLLFLSCSKSETEDLDIDFGYDYYPLEVGLEYIYQVDSIIFREGVGRILADTSRTFFREVIIDSLRDNAGQLVYRIERFERSTTDAPWRITKVLTASRTDRQAFRTEDNLRFINLVFPLHEGVRWDGNVFLPGSIKFKGSTRDVIIFEEWDYRVISFDIPETVAGQSYPAVATVQQADFDESILELRKAREKYARNVGLVSREWYILDSQCDFCCGGTGDACGNTPWEERVENGFILRQQLLSFKKIN
jgi:hypothetical protein